MRESPTVPAPEEQAARKRFQFSLRALLISFTILAVAVGVGPQLGIHIVPIAAAVVCGLLAIAHRGHRVDWAVATFIFLITSALLIPGESRAPRAARRSVCKNNLKQIGLALHNYHDMHGCFPPAYFADEQGRPMHSWRVLILPQLERSDLYARYRFDEPWDGPHNRLLHDELVSEFQCPGDVNDAHPKTVSYLAVVGPDTAWPGKESRRFTDFLDGTSQTILLAEVADSGVIWCEPRDLHSDQMLLDIEGKAGQGISSSHMSGAHFLFGDGSVHFLQETVDRDTIHALLTPRGRESLEVDWWAQ